MKEKTIRPRRRRKTTAKPTAGWGLLADATQRLGLWEQLLAYAARRAFALALHRLVPRLEPHARAESLEALGKTLVVRVSSSAVASELVYVKDLLLEQINMELARLASVLRAGKRGSALRLLRLQYRVGPVRALPDYAAWLEKPPPPAAPPPPRASWDLDVAAAMKQVTDADTRDALAALYAAATLFPR
jgi:hypothetical protein